MHYYSDNSLSVIFFWTVFWQYSDFVSLYSLAGKALRMIITIIWITITIITIITTTTIIIIIRITIINELI